MSKYDVPEDHWEQLDERPESQWRERTSAEIEVEVTLHDQGYQTDRKWTVHVLKGHRDHPVAVWAEEHHNKGNFWRPPNRWRDAVDFVELPWPVRKRVASMMNRSIEEITPEIRMIHREDGTGVGDRAGETSGECEVCGGEVYGEPDEDGELRHEACVDGGRDV